jgi:hypothetical protein
MFKTTRWECVICQDPVSELGAYAKLSLRKYAHVGCLVKKLHTEGVALGRKEILDEQKAERAREQRETEERLRRIFDGLMRCQRCGIRMNSTTSTFPLAWGETVLASGTDGVCSLCVRGEVQARARARQPQAPATPAEAVRQAPSALPSAPPGVEAARVQTALEAAQAHRAKYPNGCGYGGCDVCPPPKDKRFELLDMD